MTESIALRPIADVDDAAEALEQFLLRYTRPSTNFVLGNPGLVSSSIAELFRTRLARTGVKIELLFDRAAFGANRVILYGKGTPGQMITWTLGEICLNDAGRRLPQRSNGQYLVVATRGSVRVEDKVLWSALRSA
jgi:hypothetical protein